MKNKTICQRCICDCKSRQNLVTHLGIKKQCKVNLELGGIDTDREVIIKALDTNTVPCRHCGKLLKTTQSRNQHEKDICPLRPSMPSAEILPYTTVCFTFGVDYRDTIFVKYVKSGEEGLLQCIRDLYFDHASQKYNNLRKMNETDKYMQIFDGFFWKNELASQALATLIDFVGQQYTMGIENSLAKGDLTTQDVDDFRQELGIPLRWEIYTGDGELYKWDKHQPIKVRVSERLTDIIVAESKLIENITQHVIIQENCNCLNCKRDFLNEKTPRYKLKHEFEDFLSEEVCMMFDF